jgi:hypothetical protein
MGWAFFADAWAGAQENGSFTPREEDNGKTAECLWDLFEAELVPGYKPRNWKILSPGPGGRWEDVLPDKAPSAFEKAGWFQLGRILQASGKTSMAVVIHDLCTRMSCPDGHLAVARRLGFDLGMESLGSGVSWNDDHEAPHGLVVPLIEIDLVDLLHGCTVPEIRDLAEECIYLENKDG